MVMAPIIDCGLHRADALGTAAFRCPNLNGELVPRRGSTGPYKGQ
jgi:hypothetical protein